MSDQLIRKTGKGVAWNMLGQAIQQAISFSMILVLARLLDPKDFGIFAMVLVFTEFVGPLREWGFQAALIQKKEIDEEYKSTAFWAMCGTGLFLYLISVACASPVSLFFNNNQLKNILPVIAVSFLLSPFGGVQWAMLNREMKFKVLAIRNTVAALGYGIITCVLAFKGFGVWALVWGFVIRELLWSAIFWVVYDWHPLFKFNKAKFKEMIRFGLNCIGSSILGRIIDNIDNLFVGKFLGAIKLGYYNLAFNTVSQPKTKFVYQITRVIFPAYSLIQHDDEKMKTAYQNTIKVIMMAITPLLAILFVSADSFVSVFYGSKWLPAVLPIQIMCFYAFLHTIANPASSVFLSKGRPDIDLKIVSARLFLLVIFLYVGVWYGIAGVATAVLLHSIVTSLPTLYFANRLLKIDNRRFYLTVLRYVCIYFVIIAFIAKINSLPFLHVAYLIKIWQLLINISLGLSAYCLIMYVFFRDDFFVIFKLAKKVFLKDR
ncbi:MAG: MOP flippase family protein [Candidatus Omnitrophica bacterium]|nr:MOP flippase family protein [Candidatus Omnitrophota bacterium]